LFNPRSGRSVTVPLDHGIALGSIAGLTHPMAVMKRLIGLSPEAILIGPGLAKLSIDMFATRDAPARILTADQCLFSSVPGEIATPSETGLLSSVDFALRYDVDCIKVVLVWGLERKKQLRNLTLVGHLAEECDRVGIPLMVEPVLWGDLIPKEDKNNPELIEHAARVALEVGADVLKIPYAGSKESFASLVERLSVPVLVLGGAKMQTTEEVLQVASDSVQAGARGIVFGRNVWQHSSMESMVKALQAVVHEDADVETAIRTQQLQAEQ